MAVCECVIFANLAQNIGLSHVRCHERLFELESFLFDAGRDVELGIGLVGGEQILTCQVGRLWHAYEG